MIAVVDEFADGVPLGSCTLAESGCFGCAKAGEKDVAYVGYGGSFVARNGFVCDGSFEISDDLKDFRLVERIEVRVCQAGGISGLGAAVQRGEMRRAQSIAVRMGRKSAVASIGKGETAEGKFGRVVALAGHGESIAKNTHMSRHAIGTSWANLGNGTWKCFRMKSESTRDEQLETITVTVTPSV
jgi:hypothetical protein